MLHTALAFIGALAGGTALALGSVGTTEAEPPPTAPGVGGPICDAGPVQFVDCAGQITTVMLDGTASSGTAPLTYLWSAANCPGFMLDDPTSPTPLISIMMNGQCLVECGAIQLTVTDATGASSSCTTAVVVQDMTPPTISCPPDVTLPAGSPTDPGNTGMATATDSCMTPLVTWSDSVAMVGGDTVITRTWTADDGCFTQSCDQIITVQEPPPQGDPALDIKPGSCPNPVNVGSNGVIPISLLGTAGFDVTLVDLATLQLVRADGVGGSVAPGRTRIADTGTPFTGTLCDCHELTGDGILDISMKFHKQSVVSALQLDTLPSMSFVTLSVVGQLQDGTAFSASDCIRVQ